MSVFLEMPLEGSKCWNCLNKTVRVNLGRISSTCIECDPLFHKFVVCISQGASCADTTRRDTILCLWCIVLCLAFIEVFRTDSMEHSELRSWVKEETLQDSQIFNGRLILPLF